MAVNESQQHFPPHQWSAYTDGELPAPVRQQMRTHLQTCAECRALARSFEAVQRGAEELARRAEPPPARLRPKLLAVAAALLERSHKQRLWVMISAISVTVVLGIGVFWFASRQTETPSVGPQTVVSHGVKISLDRVDIERIIPYPPTLMYDVTIRNDSDAPLVITRALASGPLGETSRTFEVRVEKRQTEKRGFPQTGLTEDATLLSGRYRITFWTADGGSLTAEQVLTAPQQR
jgi:hypothetical protein